MFKATSFKASFSHQGSRSSSKFITCAHAIVEALMSTGDWISHCYLIELILEALHEEFDSIVANDNGKSDPVSLDELEPQLLTLEAHVEKFKKASSTELASVYLTQIEVPSSLNFHSKFSLRFGGLRP